MRSIVEFKTISFTLTPSQRLVLTLGLLGVYTFGARVVSRYMEWYGGFLFFAVLAVVLAVSYSSWEKFGKAYDETVVFTTWLTDLLAFATTTIYMDGKGDASAVPIELMISATLVFLLMSLFPTVEYARKNGITVSAAVISVLAVFTALVSLMWAV